LKLPTRASRPSSPRLPTIYNSCVTADQLKHTDHVSFSNDDDRWTCTQNSVTSLDKNTVAAKGDCANSKDGTHMTGSGKIQALDREHFKGSGKLKVTSPALGDVPFTNNITLTGKWVRAACPASH
jgi:hypothetical protein